MGYRQQYKCNACPYSVMTGGGKQVGMRSIQWTIRCHDCATLMDIFVSGEPWERDAAWAPTDVSCPKNPAHRVALWSPKDGCPKCHGQMGVAEGGEMMLWD